jgi:hypothetical protein
MAALDREEVRQFKTNRRYAGLAIVVLAVLTVTAIVLAIQFDLQRKIAVREALVAKSQKFAAQSEATRNLQLDLSLLLSVASSDTYNTFESNRSLINALSAR